jgi:hypothetical protein
MMKPQLAWWAEVDNSYYPFVPKIGEIGKVNGQTGLQKEISQAIKDKQDNPSKYRSFKFGDHKIQKS